MFQFKRSRWEIAVSGPLDLTHFSIALAHFKLDHLKTLNYCLILDHKRLGNVREENGSRN